MIAVQPQAWGRSSRISTASTSPGCAPRTNTGPVTGLTRSKSSAATSAGVESAVSWPPEASAVSSSTVSPDSISSTGAIELSQANETDSERILCSEWSCSWLTCGAAGTLPLASVAVDY